MPPKKPKINPLVRTKLEELGADAVRSKLIWIMNVRSLAQEDDPEPIGDGLTATRWEMQEWLKEKDRLRDHWVKLEILFAGLAAIFAFLAWRFPVKQ